MRSGRSVLIVALSALGFAPAAGAQTTSCNGNHYFLINRGAFPSIRHERAINLPRLTSRYAPRCLVADSIAGDIQFYWSQHARLPSSLHVGGARWDAGKWQLHYATRHLRSDPMIVYMHLAARHDRETVTMDLGS